MASTPLTAAQRTIRARAAAFTQHAMGRTSTANATAASMARFEREVDPEGSLAPEERARRAGYARRAYMSKLALRSSVVRSRKAGPDRYSGPAVEDDRDHNDRTPTAA